MKSNSVDNQKQRSKPATRKAISPSRESLEHHTLGFFTTKGKGDVESLAFAMPDRCLLPEASNNLQGELWPLQNMAFRPRTRSAQHNAFYASGTLNEWKRMVRPLGEEPWYVFAICAGLACPFMQIAQLDHLLLNVYGPSRTGKTLGLQLAASSWGSASGDHCFGLNPSLIQNVNADTELLGKQADPGSAIFLALDELTDAPVKWLNQTDIDCIQPHHHVSSGGLLDLQSTLVISCSRWPLLTNINQNKESGDALNKSAHVMSMAIGQLASASSMTVQQKKRITKALPIQLRHRFGTAGPALVQGVLNQFVTAPALRSFLAEEIDDAYQLLLDDLEQQFPKYRARNYEELTPTRIETLRHLSAIYVVGMLAIEMGILPFDDDDIVHGICTARNAWLGGLSPVIEGYEDIANVREYLWRFQQPDYYSSRWS